MNENESVEMHILLIDDDPVVYDVTRMMLRRTGHTLVWAKNGIEALQKLSGAELPDLILCDIMMPGMNGIETLEAIRSDPRLSHLPVAMITAHRQTTALERARSLGAKDYIFKPFRRAEVLEKVNQILM